MNILNIEIIKDSTSGNIFLGSIIALLAAIFIIAAIIAFVDESKVAAGIGLMLLALVLGFCAYCWFTITPQTHKYVECTFVDGYSMPIEELQNYKLIEQRGEIYKFEIIEDKN